MNCFYDIPDSSQFAKARMKMKVMFIAVDSNMYNGDGMKNCFHDNNNSTINNKNTNNNSITPKILTKE